MLGEDVAVVEGRAETPADSGDQAGVVRACAARTLAAAGAKVEWREDWILPSYREARRRRRSGGLLAPVGRAAGRVAKAIWKRATNDLRLGHLAAKGILEPASGRYMIDYGSFAQIHDGQHTFGGRSGRPLATLAPFAPARSADMLWVLRILLRTTDAGAEGEDVVHGCPCTKLGIHVDLAAASAALPEGLPSARVESFEQLHALPATVWVDGEYIRRVEFADIESRQLFLELWDFGVAADEFDWSRLPTFRSPGEAAFYAGQGEPWYQKFRARIRH